MNYYEILEVSPNASQTVIRAAYKSLMQRYHPDKNPNDAAGAERASQVVQAYEVLSDNDKRAAYDFQLKAKAGSRAAPAGNYRETLRPAGTPAAYARKSAEKEGRYFWYLCLVIGIIIVSGFSMVSLLKKQLSPAAAKASVPQKSGPAATPEAGPGRADGPREAPQQASQVAPGGERGATAGEIPDLVTKLMVNLKRADRPWEDSGRILFIPTIGVKVGTRDAEHAIRHLNNTSDLIRQKLQESLAEAKLDELMKPDGEQYLARLILTTISEATGTGKIEEVSQQAPDSLDRYGVVGVALPEMFTVK